MKIKINEGFLGLKDNYLFSEVARRVRDYGSAIPKRKNGSFASGSAMSRFRLRRASSQRRGAPPRRWAKAKPFAGTRPSADTLFSLRRSHGDMPRSAYRSTRTKYSSRTVQNPTRATSSTSSATAPYTFPIPSTPSTRIQAYSRGGAYA